MFRTTLRNVTAHKGRLLMTMLAVLLGVAFLSATLVFTDTFAEAYRKSSEQSFAYVDVAIRPGRAPEGGPPGARPALTQDLLHDVARLPEARTVIGSVTGFTAIAGKDGALAGQGWSTRGANYYPGPGGADPRYAVARGRAPQNAGEIMLDARSAERTGYRVGDTVRLSVDGPVLKEKLVGVFTTDDGEVAAGGTLTLFDTATAQRLFAEPGIFSEITAKASPGASQVALRAAVEKVLPEGAVTFTGDSLARDQAVRVEGTINDLRSTLLVFAGIALFVGVFLIANTFTMLTAQRTREFALLRAIGASRRQITRSVLVEALLIGSVAGCAGMVAGIGVAACLRGLIGSFGSGGQVLPDGPLVVSPAAVVVSLAVGVLVTMAAAWPPARRAGRIPPVAAMSAVHAPATSRSLVVRNTVGAILAAAGAATVLAGTGMDFDEGQYVIGLGASTLLTGVFVLTPLLSRPFIAAVTPLLRRMGAPGKLARENALRNPRRTAATASALTIGLAVITGLTVIATSSREATDARATATLSADYVVRMGNYDDLSVQVEDALKATDRVTGGVTAVSPLREVPARVAGSNMFLTGVDAGVIGDLLRPEFTRGSLSGLGTGGALVDAGTAAEHGWTTGTALPVTFPDGGHGRVTISGVYQDTDLLHGLVIDTHLLDPHLRTRTAGSVLVKTAHGPSRAAKDAIIDALGDSPAILVQSKQDVSTSIAHSITVMLNLLYGLLAMAVIVAVLGVVNTLVMSVVERSAEIGMLRAIGLDRGGVRRMVRLESLVISLFGATLGAGLGVFFGWAGVRLLATDTPAYRLILPWGQIALVLALATVIGVVAAVWPARNAARLDMLTAIQSG
ncbi:ABC transporter permease [Microbispora bryophytorum]|uniref:ABC transporter permease n=1 Tax=Microbispora bryophytorum TaxID=1460882 RepID=UPI0033D5E91B